MLRSVVFCLIWVAMELLAQPLNPVFDNPPTPYVEGEILIGLDEPLDAFYAKQSGTVTLDRPEIDWALASLGAFQIEPLIQPNLATKQARPANNPLSSMFVVRYNSDQDVAQVCRELAQVDGIRFAEPNFRYEIPSLDGAAAFEGHDPQQDLAAQEDLGRDKKGAATNDFYADWQWPHRNTGFVRTNHDTGISSTPYCDLNVPSAWNFTTGSTAVTVAIIDTGIDVNHPDLAGRIDLATAGLWADPNDQWHGHGTLVAGVIAANANNSIGVAGIDQQCRILPLRLSSFDNVEIANAIIFAADHGARIINMSFGGAARSAVIEAAVNDAYLRGCVLFAASGNNNLARVNFPAAYPNVIAVGAASPCFERKSPTSCDGDLRMEPNADQSWGSNFGPEISIMAPGVWIATTDITGMSRGYSNDTGNRYNLATDANGDYVLNLFGTSFASPYAAGTAALMLAANPDLTPGQIRDIMQRYARNMGPAGRDNETGYGLINTATCVSRARAYSIQSNGTRPYRFGLWWDENHNGSSTEFWISPDGTATMYWATYDASGLPIWYYATNPRGLAGPRRNVFTADLHKLEYLAPGVSPVTVGHVQVEFLSNQSARFNFSLNGAYGYWNLAPFFQSWQHDAGPYGGLWAPGPQESGWGFSLYNVRLDGDQPLSAAILYYFAGNTTPRWVMGTLPAIRQNMEIPMDAFAGSCPTCPAEAPYPRSAGSLSYRFTSQNNGTVSTAITRYGTWYKTNLPISRVLGPQ